MLFSSRTRRVRAASFAIALAAPLVATATPAFAAGESTAAVLSAPTSGSSTTFTWDYSFSQNGGNGLSNIAVAFCSADILADVVSAGPVGTVFTSGDVPGGHTGFGPGVKFATTVESGTLTVTFAHPHPVSAGGLRIQSHSGGGQTGDAVTLADGPGPCPVEPSDDDDDDTDTNDDTDNGDDDTDTDDTGTGGDDNDTGGGSQGDEGDPTNTGGGNTTTNTGGGTTTTNDGGGTTTPGGGSQTATSPSDSTVLGAVEERATTPAVVVLGETVEAGTELPRTGSGQMGLLVQLAGSLVFLGVGLRLATRRRMHGASFPG